MGASVGCAAVYMRGQSVIIQSCSYLGDGDGGSVPNGWVVRESRQMDNALLGKLIREALAASGNNAPMPDFRRPQPNSLKLFEVAGVKSESQFMKGNLLVEVELKEGRINLMPTRNGGSKGFDHLPERSVDVPESANDANLGERVRAVLELCA